MTIYRGRFRQNREDQLKFKLKNYDSLKNLRGDNNPLPVKFLKFFIKKALVQIDKSVYWHLEIKEML